ncbi:MAG: response regulator [Burkholderiales bacterium]|jgi:CheY-like chemotaxis protein|nr:response regulator [Burkholderiales bacterium]
MNNALTILLVEDDDVAAESVMRSLAKTSVPFPVVWAEDGLAALEILRGQDTARHIHRPLVILLDLNMPRMNGFEFLQQLRADPDIRDEVVFVLTTSDADADRTRAYHEQIAGYMVKSAVGPQFAKLAQLLLSYASAVRLP